MKLVRMTATQHGALLGLIEGVREEYTPNGGKGMFEKAFVNLLKSIEGALKDATDE